MVQQNSVGSQNGKLQKLVTNDLARPVGPQLITRARDRSKRFQQPNEKGGQITDQIKR